VHYGVLHVNAGGNYRGERVLRDQTRDNKGQYTQWEVGRRDGGTGTTYVDTGGMVLSNE
jgi:hypothetical protein